MKPDQFITLDDIITLAAKRNPSDIFLTVGNQPLAKIQGEILATGLPRLTKENIFILLQQMWEEAPYLLKNEKDIDFAFRISQPDAENIASLRINAFLQQEQPSVVARVIKKDIPTLETMSLPPNVKKLIKKLLNNSTGLILVAGSTGSGKSSTMSSMIHYLATRDKSCHIITIEDPIERPFNINHPSEEVKIIIQQRELGKDTKSFANAIKSALRDAPDVICIGEIRDQETMSWAMKAAQTGHLVISSLHASGVIETLKRIVNFYLPHEKDAVLGQLSEVLQGIISQRLVKRAFTYYERLVWVESIMFTPVIRDAIRKEEKFDSLNKHMEDNNERGMQTFEQHRDILLTYGLVEIEDMGL